MTHTGSRNCARCGKALTDAASMDVGIGPVCRKMDNDVLARMIPSQVSRAMELWSEVSTSSIPEPARNTFGSVGADLLVEDNDDWRATCKRVEWMLSWGVAPKTKELLVALVEALGYVGLASVLRGEAAKGLCTVTFEDGRLYMQGPNNKAGRLALKAVKGRKFHPAKDGVKARWSVPASEHAEFQTVIWKHWPKFKGLEDAVAAAAAYTPEVAPEPVKESTVFVTRVGGVLKVSSPWNGDFITGLKSEIKNWKHRRWNQLEKVWEVHPSAADTLLALISKCYNEKVQVKEMRC